MRKMTLKKFKEMSPEEQLNLLYENITEEEKDIAIISWLIEGLQGNGDPEQGVEDVYNQYIK